MKKMFARKGRPVSLSLLIAGLLNWAAPLAPASGAGLPDDHALTTTPALVASANATHPGKAATQPLCEQYNNLPLRFEAAAPQANAPARFIACNQAQSILLTAAEACVVLRPPDAIAGSRQLVSSPGKRAPQPARVGWRLVDADRRARVIGEQQLPTQTNYFIGKDAAQWRSDVANYARVKVKQPYPGIDVVYYGAGRQLEYDFNVAPGASYKAIRLRFSGVRQLALDASGDLVMTTPAGALRQHKPVAYQLINGLRKTVAARFVLNGKREVAFLIGDYDRRQPLVIDPRLSISTYLGGTNSDAIRAVAVDAQGYAYVAGRTRSVDFFTTDGAVQSTAPFGSSSEYAFVAKFDPASSRLIYSTFLGGSRFQLPGLTLEGAARNAGYGLAVDAAGNAYVTGETDAVNFPTTPGCFQPNRAGQTDAFVVKLNAQGSTLVYATYLGGSKNHMQVSFGQTSGLGIAVDAMGNAYVTGQTNTDDFPTTANALKPTHPIEPCFIGDVDPAVFACTEAFVTKLNPTGTALVYSTYLGGSGNDSGNGIAIDAAGNACVVGTTEANDFPTINALQPTRGGGGDAFVAKLNAQGSTLIYSTYLGGAGRESGNGVAMDVAGNAYVTGQTASTTLPVTAGALQPLNRSATLFKSTDGGNSWQPSSVGLLSDAGISRLAVDPADSARVYAAADSIYLSDDGGRAWNRVGGLRVSSSIAFGYVFHPQNPAIIYALADNAFPTFTTKVAQSTDGGQSWKDVTTIERPDFVLEVTAAPSDPSIIYITTSLGLFRARESKDLTGFQVRDISAGLPGGRGRIVAVHPRDSSVLFAQSPFDNHRLFKSTNGGNSWQAVNLPDAPIIFIAFDPRAPRTIYAAGDRLFKSADGGESWQAIANDLPSIFFGSLAVDPLNSTTLYTATRDGLFKSADGGKMWKAADAGLPQAGAYELAIDRNNSAILYAGRVNAGTDAFVAKLNPPGSALVYLTYLGGSQTDAGMAIAVDAADSAYVTGVTYSKDFPLQRPTQADLRRSPSPDPGISIGPDAFVARLDAAGAQLDFSTYLGGGGVDTAVAIAVDTAGNLFVAGNTASDDLAVPNAFQASNRGLGDGFLARLATIESNQPSPIIRSAMPASAPSTGETTMTISGANFAAGATVSIGGVPAKVLEISDAAIQVVVPPNAPGTARLTVVNPDGQSAVLANGFAYLASPEIFSVEFGDKDLTVIGRNFDKDATILVNGTPRSTLPSLLGSPGNVLFSAKGGKKVKRGRTALIQVRNHNGLLSAPFSAARPAS